MFLLQFLSFLAIILFVRRRTSFSTIYCTVYWMQRAANPDKLSRHCLQNYEAEYSALKLVTLLPLDRSVFFSVCFSALFLLEYTVVYSACWNLIHYRTLLYRTLTSLVIFFILRLAGTSIFTIFKYQCLFTAYNIFAKNIYTSRLFSFLPFLFSTVRNAMH